MANHHNLDLGSLGGADDEVTGRHFQPIIVRGPSVSATVIADHRGVEEINTWLLEAKFALGMMLPEDLPKLAQDSLEAGHEGPAIVRLAIV